MPHHPPWREDELRTINPDAGLEFHLGRRPPGMVREMSGTEHFIERMPCNCDGLEHFYDMIEVVMAGLGPIGANLSLRRQSLCCRAPLPAGHPVIPARQIQPSVVTGSSAYARTMTTESMMIRRHHG